MNCGMPSGAMTRSASEALATPAAAGGSAKAGKRPVRALSPQEKLVAIMRVHEGESKASVARDIGVPESTLRGWCKNEAKITHNARQSSSPESSDPAEPRPKKVRPSSGGGGGTADGRLSYSPLQDASPAAAQALSRSLARRQSPPAAHTASRNLHLSAGGSAGRAADELSADLDPMARSNAMLARMAAEVVAAGTAAYPTAAAAYGAQLLRWTMQSSARPPNSTKKSTPLNIDTASNGHRLSTSPGTRPGASLLTTVTPALAGHQAQKQSPSKVSGLTADAKSAQETIATWVQQQQHQAAFAQTYLQHLGNGLSTTAASTSSNAILTTAAPPALSTAAAAAAMDPAYSAALKRMMSDGLASWYLYNSDLASLQTAVSTAPRTRKHSAAAQAADATATATATTSTTAAPAPAPATGSADEADRRILHQQQMRREGSVSPKRERPSADAKETPEYVEEEQEVAEDLSTGKDRVSNASESSSAGRPSSGLSSSMSLPSPTNPTSNSARLAESPQPTLDPAKAFPDLAGQCASSGAALDDTSDADATAKQQPQPQSQPQLLQGGKAPARRVVRPRRHLNSVLALLENRHSEAPEDRQADAEAEPAAAADDWRAAVTHGKAFVSWLETSRDASVTSFQVNTIKSILSNITKNRQAKQSH